MPRTPRTPKKEPRWLKPFLDGLVTSGGAIAPAAAAAHVARSTVYVELERNPELVERVEEIRASSIERVENTLYQAAMLTPNTTDRIFYLKTHKPDRYGEKKDDARRFKLEGRQELLVELQAELARLPRVEQEQLMTAMRRAELKRAELNP